MECNLEYIYEKFSCREKLVNTLHELIGEEDEPLPNCIFIYGQKAVGKTAIVREYLRVRNIKFAYVNCIECYTHKLLFDSITSQLFPVTPIKCDNMMNLINFLKQLPTADQKDKRLVIVLDGIEHLEELGAHYLTAFNSLQELVNNRFLSMFFISQILPEKLCPCSSAITIYFPQYNKDELMDILKKTKPEMCPARVYDNYLTAALSMFLRSTRDLNEMKFLVKSNFDHYYEPIKKGTISAENVASLWKNVSPYFQSSLNTVYSGMNAQNIERFQYDPHRNKVVCNKGPSVLDLPYYAKYFLIAAYLASYNSPKHDKRLFLKHHGKKRKRATIKQIKEKQTLELLGPKPFPLDRLLAIFYAIMEDKARFTVNLMTQITTLVELRLLAKIGESNLDCPKYKCLVGLHYIDSIAKTLEFDMSKYLLE